MVIMTAKLSKAKLIVALLIIAAVILMTVVILSGPGQQTTPEESVSPSGAATNSDRLAFLSSFGWTVNGDPIQTQQVRIPDTPSEVFDRYNELQISQGYDLTQYAGKTVNRYVYEIENVENTDTPTYATLLVFDDQIIGGDISSAAPDGIMHGFEKPSSGSALNT